jgi:hypothetical protein
MAVLHGDGIQVVAQLTEVYGWRQYRRCDKCWKHGQTVCASEACDTAYRRQHHGVGFQIRRLGYTVSRGLH